MRHAAAIGVDVGSTTWKAVALDAQGEIVARHLEPTHPRIEEQNQRALALLHAQPGVASDLPVGATGYGRKRVEANRVLTEITCHARGAFQRTGGGGVLIDMGGQDTKIVRFSDRGSVEDFAMNDKCAAGTGRFIEVILGRLQVPLDAIPERLAGASRTVAISSTCTVFAESEVVSLVAQGEPVDGILSGLHVALASRVAALAAGMVGAEPLYMSGGVALNTAMVRALESTLRKPIQVLPDPQLVGAVGAALAVLPS